MLMHVHIKISPSCGRIEPTGLVGQRCRIWLSPLRSVFPLLYICFGNLLELLLLLSFVVYIF